MINSKKYTGVQIYKCKNADLCYYVKFKFRGVTHRKKVGRKSEGITESIAHDFRNRILSETRHGLDLTISANRKRLTFQDLVNSYFEHGTIHAKSNKRYEQIYQKHLFDLGALHVMSITDANVLNIQRALMLKNLSPAAINSYIKFIQRVFNFAVKKGYIDRTPLRDIKKLKVDNARQRYLTLDEINQLYAAIKGDTEATAFTLLSLSTGGRAESILNVKKIDIDVKQRTIKLFDYKRSMTYTAHLTDEALNFIEPAIRGLKPNDYVVGRSPERFKYYRMYYTMSKHFKKFNQGLEPTDRQNRVVIHTLRHTFASHLAIAGVPLQTIQKLMNHANISQTNKYAHLTQESGRDNVRELYKSPVKEAKTTKKR